MREVKAQVLGSNERSCLVHMVAEHVLKGSVEQVRRGVVAAQERAAMMVDRGVHDGAFRKLSLLDDRAVRIQAVVSLGVTHGKAHALSRQRARIAHLPAHLGIERGSIEHDLDLLASAGMSYALAVNDKRKHLGTLKLFILVSSELGCGNGIRELRPNIVERTPGIALHVRAGALALRLHLAVEAVDVNSMARALGDLDGEVDREAEGIVQLEGGGAIEHGTVCKTIERLVEVDAAGVERAREALLLRIDDTLDKGDVLEKLRVGVTHELVYLIDETTKERPLDADQASVEDRAAQQAAQHVAAALVAGQYAVGDQEVDRTGMIGDDAERPALPLIIVAHVRDS